MSKVLSLFVGLALLAPQSSWALNHNAKMAWWRDARFGMFIHWGPYAQLAGYFQNQKIESGQMAKFGAPDQWHPVATGEWIQAFAGISDADYRSQAVAPFKPTNFNALDIVRRAKNAGMKYIVFTAKHHDGFAMYDSKHTSFKFPSAANNMKDPLMELGDACRAEGIKFGIYYSIWDWYHEQLPDYDKFMQNQLTELVRDYHPDLLWFDGQWKSGWSSANGKQTRDALLNLQPNLIINDRIEGNGDYGTFEQTMPQTAPTHDWEFCQTLGNTWGYRAFESSWKSTTTLIHYLVDVASKGGNYLLNIGPDQSGAVPSASQNRLRDLSAWWVLYGESVRGTEPIFYGATQPGIRLTRKTGRLYVHVLNGTSKDEWGKSTTYSWPAEVRIPKLSNPISRVYSLSQPGVNLPYSTVGDQMVIALPAVAPNPHDSVIVVEVTGMPILTVTTLWGHVSEAPLVGWYYDGAVDGQQVFGTAVDGAHSSGFRGVEMAPGSNVISNINSGDWWENNIDVRADGKYYHYGVRFYAATTDENFTIDIMLDGVNLGQSALAATGNMSTFEWSSDTIVPLSIGRHTLRFVANNSNGSAQLNVKAVRYQITDTGWYPGQKPPATFEAESHGSSEGGTQVVLGQDQSTRFVGYIDPGDYVAYRVVAPEGGKYRTEFRVASPQPEGAFDVYVDDVRQEDGRVYVPVTGSDWETFTTVLGPDIWLAKGAHTIKLVATGYAFNIDKLRVWKPFPMFMGRLDVEAEAFARSSGVNLVSLSDSANGNQAVASIDNTTDYLEYKILVERPGVYEARYRLSGGGTLAFKLGSMTAAQTKVAAASDYRWVDGTLVKLNAGYQTIRLQPIDGEMSLDKLTLVQKYSSGAHIIRKTGTTTVQAEKYFRINGLKKMTGSGGVVFLGDANSRGEYADYEVLVEEAGWYSVTMRVASAQSGGAVAVRTAFPKYSADALAYETRGELAVPMTSGWEKWTNQNISVWLPAGRTILRIEAATPWWNLDRMTFARNM